MQYYYQDNYAGSRLTFFMIYGEGLGGMGISEYTGARGGAGGRILYTGSFQTVRPASRTNKSVSMPSIRRTIQSSRVQEILRIHIRPPACRPLTKLQNHHPSLQSSRLQACRLRFLNVGTRTPAPQAATGRKTSTTAPQATKLQFPGL
jgi:hypothetical protein